MNQISIDEAGDHIATCSDDGRVSLYKYQYECSEKDKKIRTLEKDTGQSSMQDYGWPHEWEKPCWEAQNKLDGQY